ncbi:3-oxoacyl-[acyl-carrier-protein] reductase FabG-like [Styela clava]
MSFGRLAGKVALVTGGGSGIGKAVCKVFANEGASVAVLDVNGDSILKTAESLSRNHGNTHCAIPLDVTSQDQVKNSIKTAEETLGKKGDVLVNSAGIIRDNLLLKLTESQFDDVLNVNLKGTFLLAQEFARSLVEGDHKKPGSIINLSSIVGKTGNIGQTNYAASKAGVIGLTKTIALEFGKYNVRCNAVLPGFILTPMTEGIPDLIIEKLEGSIPLKRRGNPEEVANVCLFLASNESSYVTGTCLEVAGGLGV